MLRSILVGLDGSPYSRSAVELGIAWAKKADALLVGLGVIDQPEIAAPMATPIGGGAFKGMIDESRLKDARLRVERFLDEFSRRACEAQVACKLLEDVGLPNEMITLEAQRYDLVLLGAQTYFEFETRSGPCATLHEVLMHSPRPVVTAPENLPSGETVVIAYDGSLQTSRAVAALVATGLCADRPVHVVSFGGERKEAAKAADRAIDFLSAHKIKAESHAEKLSGPAAKAILAKAHDLDAGLLVMGAYGKPRLHEFFLGSVTRSILKEAKLPLFLYH